MSLSRPASAVACSSGHSSVPHFVSDAERRRSHRDLFPCPLPYQEKSITNVARLATKSRTVRSRLRRHACTEEWANQGVQALNEVFSRAPPLGADPVPPTEGQRSSLERIRAAYSDIAPPECKSTAAAFNVLCGSRPGYGAEVPSGAARLRRDSKVSLPPKGLVFADATQLLRGKNLRAWTQWRTS